MRRKSRQIKIGSVTIGGDAPIRIQSMTNTETSDVDATVAQIERMTEAGCELIRVSVPDSNSAQAIKDIKKRISIPLIADIHFNWRMALEAIDQGADAIRINPGNIGEKDIEKIVIRAKEAGVPVRIGVNGGSLKKKFLKKYGHPIPEALVESALETVSLFEKLDFYQTKISVKTSSVPTTIEAYRLIAKEVDYPLHVGVSEAGPLYSGMVKSSVGIGTLLSEGIGDTIRVSLTADPVEEVRVAREILKSLGLKKGIEIISCPTCARCQVDLISLVGEVEKLLSTYNGTPIKIALMGCVVNGPGEAAEADVGIAAGSGAGILFKKGKILRRLEEKDYVRVLMSEIEKLATGR
ncbi:MAG: flavodoxin-dependent (E)-4-hydroxy-3-methylbut-2-enyl-diphosphate synthase [Actinomycetota bacterium]